MKVRINNKLYNTETGRYICNSARGELYRKYHSIEHFLYDALRKTITPITWDEAKEITRTNAPREMYNSMFVPRLHYGRSNIDLPLEHYDKLRDIAARHNRSMKQELQLIINKEYRNRDRHKRL